MAPGELMDAADSEDAGLPPATLRGRRILVTRTRAQSSTLAEALRVRGAEVIEIPTIRIEPPQSFAALDAALARLREYDTLLVTSANTAQALASRLATPWAHQPFTVAIGPATRDALLGYGLRVDLEPRPSVAESVIAALAPTAAGKRMLLVRAAVARELLPEALRAAGARVDVVEAYRTVLAGESAAKLAELFAGDEHSGDQHPGAAEIDAVTFTSSSTVENFVALLGEGAAHRALARSRACSIGPITSDTLRRHGFEPAIEAESHDVAGLVRAIEALFHT
ncbi:uroporphyrinogen-III synthase [Acidipila sp. EB88]|uniref:uroporphyrinogen-III synthase n=1 Tax=Acidipila sp. EB88 TaxID=2305226 RepID=UPI000F5D4F64|nr:uroporphyrinogen-III synthase [Acidipila sp. EB88]RRA49445.1 uroporphyrinogen-III synthase [Acidipila sp. EB88]